MLISARDPSITANINTFKSRGKIYISFDIGDLEEATKKDWIGLYPYGIIPSADPVDWQYVCGGKEICGRPIAAGTISFSTPLTDGKWTAWYLWGDGSGRKLLAGATFTVVR